MMKTCVISCGWEEAYTLLPSSAFSLHHLPLIHGLPTQFSPPPHPQIAQSRASSLLSLGTRAGMAEMAPELWHDDDGNSDWEAQMIAEMSPLPPRGRPAIRTARRKSVDAGLRAGRRGGDEEEWAARARRLGLATLESKAFSAEDLDRLVSRGKKRTKKLRHAAKSPAAMVNAKEAEAETRVAEADSGELRVGPSLAELSRNGAESHSGLAKARNPNKNSNSRKDGRRKEKENVQMELAFEELVSGFSQSDSQRQLRDERSLNRALVQADDPEEVLRLVVGENPALLTARNMATAIHRIARHVERLSSTESARLTIARKREMLDLVGLAMSVLYKCSAQGVSNIAWALSKLGGRLLYEAEMDSIAKAVIDKADQFNAQNVANTAGAFASMQHSAPEVFDKLALSASSIARSFKPQELAQVLWSFASLNHPAHPLLNSLDIIAVEWAENDQTRVCEMVELDENGNGKPSSDNFELLNTVDGGDFMEELSFAQLANIAWSYAALGELERPFFSLLFQKISARALELRNKSGPFSLQLDGWQRLLGQLHQVFMCLRLEYSHLKLSIDKNLEELAHTVWEEDKRSSKITSLSQKHLQYLLASSGKNWVYEYSGAEYSLDAALVEEKIAIEVDGPSHFTRNTGLPLGHTVLKRRLLKASGWRVVPIPYHQWETVQGEAQQKQFLQQLLESWGCQ